MVVDGHGRIGTSNYSNYEGSGNKNAKWTEKNTVNLKTMIYGDSFQIVFICLILICSLIFTIVRIRENAISRAKFATFLTLVILLTISRLGLFVYLKFFVRHYEYTVLDNVLEFLLYPELPVVNLLIPGLMPEATIDPVTPIHYRPMFWIILILPYLFGSFLWSFPTLILFSKQKKEVSSDE